MFNTIPMMRVFPYIMATLQFCAAIVCLYYRDYRMALVWGCAGTANSAIAGLR
jgi:hypothetical protein